MPQSHKFVFTKIILLAVLVIIFRAVGQNFSVAHREKDQKWLTPNQAASIDKALLGNESLCYLDGFLKRNVKDTWSKFLLQTSDALRYIACQTHTYYAKGNTATPKDPTGYILIYTSELSQMTAEFEKILSCSEALPFQSMSWKLDACCDKGEVQNILMDALYMESSIRSFVVASSYAEFVHLVLDVLTSDNQFKWRRLFHATEWIILTTDQSSRSLPIFKSESLPDFMTVFLSQGMYIDINQKSRTHPMKTVFQISPDLDHPRNHVSLKTSWPFNFTTLEETLAPSQQSDMFQHLRKNAVTHLSTQKSEMAGMNISVVVVASEPDREVFLKAKGNVTSWDGFSVDILNLLANALGFDFHIFQVTDGGFYSVFQPDGEILGLTGYLARREAGFSPNVMINSASRRRVLDFIYPSTKNDPYYFMYRVKFGQSQLGNPLNELTDSRQDCAFVLIGPIVALLVGLIVFLVSGVFGTGDKILGRTNIRRLYNFPLHWLFQTTEPYPHQSGRILRASWGLFCVAMLAAYSAMLTSNATAPLEYPKLTSLVDLLNQHDFQIGTSPYYSNSIRRMREASRGTNDAKLWKVMCQQNKSDPGIFNEDKAYHIRRVLQGNYAFLCAIPVGLLPTIVDADYSDVRFVELPNDRPLMSLPQNAFYKSAIERVLQSAEEMGIINAISLRWFPHEAYLNRSKTENNTEVHGYRLKVLVLIVAMGIGSGLLSIAAELYLKAVSK